MNPDILVVGSHAPALFIDVKRPPLPGETVLGSNFQEPQDGGKGSNQAIAAARLGASVSFIGRVGSDRLGDELKDWLINEGVDFSYLIQDDEYSTGAGFNIQTDEGDCALITSMGANEFITNSQIESAINEFQEAKVLLTQFEIPVDTALFAVQKAAEFGIIPILNPAPAELIPINALKNTGAILVPNQIEAASILGNQNYKELDSEDFLYGLMDLTGASIVIITLGKNGFKGLDKNGFWELEPPLIIPLDASGAGDEFCAALGVALAEEKDIRQAAFFASKAAALSVTRQGTIPAFPYRDEVEQFTYERI